MEFRRNYALLETTINAQAIHSSRSSPSARRQLRIAEAVDLPWKASRASPSFPTAIQIAPCRSRANHLNIEFVSFRENLDTGGPLGQVVVIIIGAIAKTGLLLSHKVWVLRSFLHHQNFFDVILVSLVGCLDTFECCAFYKSFRLDLKHIAFTGNHLIQHGIDEESDEEAGDETCHDDYGEWPLCIRSDAG